MTTTRHPIRLSVVIATHNRSAALRRTLAILRGGDLDPATSEIIVVDNASTDDSGDVADSYADRVVRLTENAGSCAKADGVAVARGEIVLFLDDDSYPTEGSVPRMMRHFEADPSLGAAGFQVHLPSGARECAALPDVFVGCGVGLRRQALDAAGGLDRSFFMQAEEYDLAFRLAKAGWRMRLFDDLHVRHEKTEKSRKGERTTYFDVRNNLRVIARHLPSPMHRIYRADALTRYEWLARSAGHEEAFAQGVHDGRLAAMRERRAFRATRLTPAEAEPFFAWRAIRNATQALADRGVRRVVLADFGKNIFAFCDACRRAGMAITAIGDDRFAARERCYRGVPLRPLDEALATRVDAVIVSNCAPMFANETAARVASQCCKPAFQWFGRSLAAQTEAAELVSSARATDKPGAFPPVFGRD